MAAAKDESSGEQSSGPKAALEATLATRQGVSTLSLSSTHLTIAAGPGEAEAKPDMKVHHHRCTHHVLPSSIHV